MPSKDAQVRMMRQAYDEAGLDPWQTVYIEAHGMASSSSQYVKVSAEINF
jgi:acyl transferase domain-containing protein